MLTTGAHTVLIRVRNSAIQNTWATNLLHRRHVNVVAIALANKNARVAWALMVSGRNYEPSHEAAGV